MLTPKSIDQLRQNKPTLIVEDIIKGGVSGDKDYLYETLLCRGVFKWFSVRRKLIKLKDRWKERVTTSLDYQLLAKVTGRWHRVWYWRGYRKALEECRAEIRELCHSPRWQIQDNDPIAARWLKDKEERLETSILPSCECLAPEVSKDAHSGL